MTCTACKPDSRMSRFQCLISPKEKNIAARQPKQQVSVITGDQHRRNNTAEFTIGAFIHSCSTSEAGGNKQQCGGRCLSEPGSSQRNISVLVVTAQVTAGPLNVAILLQTGDARAAHSGRVYLSNSGTSVTDQQK